MTTHPVLGPMLAVGLGLAALTTSTQAQVVPDGDTELRLLAGELERLEPTSGGTMKLRPQGS